MAFLRYLLDTNILLAVIHDNPLGQYITATYPLRRQRVRPLLCIVSEGEIRSLAAQFGWGAAKMQALEQMLLLDLDLIDVSATGIIEAYVKIELASLAHPPG